MVLKIALILVLVTFVNAQVPAIDTEYLKSVLDAEECDRQIQYIKGNALLGLQFADAGIRIPKGVLVGATTDLGNYHQCLGIEHAAEDMDIRGKYCAIHVPGDQSIQFPPIGTQDDSLRLNPSSLYVNNDVTYKVEKFNSIREDYFDMGASEEYYTRTGVGNPLAGSLFSLGVCVPRPCSPDQAITSLLFNVSQIGFQFSERFCRLPNDKPWGPAEYIAIGVLSFIGFLTLLSTSYDLYHRFVLETNVKEINPIYQSCSIFTNTQRLMSFNSGSGTMQCIDGIRTLAMLWVIIGHSFGTEPVTANPLDSFFWMISAEGMWITLGTMTVDTFFTLTGILVVYTTAGKTDETKFIKNLHWFYLSRIVRIIPLLAVTVLLEASFFNHLTDGPFWQTVASRTDRCRTYWWSTLLFLQNLIHPRNMCVGHSWYIAIDMHLYIVSPVVLYWVFTGNKRKAWTALLTALVAVLAASTTYNFIMSLQAGVIVPGRGEDSDDYMPFYYMNTLPRASPFFVGLIFGYILHLCRGKKVTMSWFLAILCWLWCFATLGAIGYFNYRIMQLDWDNQFWDNFMNSFMRPAWAYVICWIIFACVHGYAGPINWFLSLDVWRVPARLTYGMYLLHYPLMFSVNGAMVTPIFFTVSGFTFKFLSHLVLAIVASYIFTMTVDSPISVLYRQLMVTVQKKATEIKTQEAKLEQSDKAEPSNIVEIAVESEDKTRKND